MSLNIHFAPFPIAETSRKVASPEKRAAGPIASYSRDLLWLVATLVLRKN
jgi:hypothetical protein